MGRAVVVFHYVVGQHVGNLGLRSVNARPVVKGAEAQTSDQSRRRLRAGLQVPDLSGPDLLTVLRPVHSATPSEALLINILLNCAAE